MPEFVIHVGPHKTGTTYLQLSLRAARAALRERNILVADIWDHAAGNPSQSKLAAALRDGREAELAGQIASLIATGCERIVISSEDVSNLPLPALRSLRKLTAGHAVRIIFYIRRWSETVPSAWQEGIKGGQVFTLPEFVLSHAHRPQQSRLLNIDLKINPFVQIFGLPALTLVSYSELRDAGTDMFSHFAANFLGWETGPAMPGTKLANASRNPRETELLRSLNALARARGTPAPDALRRFFDQSLNRGAFGDIFESMTPFMQALKFSDEWPALRRIEMDVLTRYRARLIAPKREDALFKPATADLRYVAPDWTLQPGIAAAVNAVHAQAASAG